MLAERPDWCISRQRVLGRADPGRVRAPNVGDDFREAEEGIFKPRARGRHRLLVHAEARANWSARANAPSAAATDLKKEEDILDVWFESGCSHRAVRVTILH